MYSYSHCLPSFLAQSHIWFKIVICLFFLFVSNARYTETCSLLAKSSIGAGCAAKHEKRGCVEVCPQRKSTINKDLQEHCASASGLVKWNHGCRRDSISQHDARAAIWKRTAKLELGRLRSAVVPTWGHLLIFIIRTNYFIEGRTACSETNSFLFYELFKPDT